MEEREERVIKQITKVLELADELNVGRNDNIEYEIKMLRHYIKVITAICNDNEESEIITKKCDEAVIAIVNRIGGSLKPVEIATPCKCAGCGKEFHDQQLAYRQRKIEYLPSHQIVCKDCYTILGIGMKLKAVHISKIN